MGYEPEANELFYCGKCDRAQEPSKGEKCVACGRQTVSWYQNREKLEAAQRKWKNVNG